MIELARAQDEEVGDGTTSVIILAGEIMSAVEGFLDKDIHPTVIVGAYFKALEESVKIIESLGVRYSASNIRCVGANKHGRRQRFAEDSEVLHWHKVLIKVGQFDSGPRSEGCEDCLQKEGKHSRN